MSPKRETGRAMEGERCASGQVEIKRKETIRYHRHHAKQTHLLHPPVPVPVPPPALLHLPPLPPFSSSTSTGPNGSVRLHESPCWCFVSFSSPIPLPPLLFMLFILSNGPMVGFGLEDMRCAIELWKNEEVEVDDLWGCFCW